MDVTPQLLKDVDFREKKFGGYDPDEVDDFLERVGVAIGQLQMRLREAGQRAEAAEARLAEAPPIAASVETDDTLRRTLLLAQRTADAAVAEAQEESDRLVGSAQEEADRLVSEAQERHDRKLQESEDEVRRSVDTTRERLLQEITALEAIRDQLMTDVEALERHVDDERARLNSTVESLQSLLDAAGTMAPIAAPVVSSVIPPAEPEPDFSAPVASAPATPEATPTRSDDAPAMPEPAADLLGQPQPVEPPAPVEVPAPIEVILPADPPAEVAPVDPSPQMAPEPEPAPVAAWDVPFDTSEPTPAPPGEADLFQQPPPPPPPPSTAPPQEEPPAGFGGLESGQGADPWADLPDGGPPTQAMDAPLAGEDDDNPWMADLAREERANQPAPAPPSDDEDAMAEWYRQQEEAAPKPEKSRRFGRKK